MCVWLLNSFLLGSQFFLDHETFKNNDAEAVDDEASENQVDVDDVEVDELESDDGEEELDTWNGFGNQMSALHIFCAVSFDKAF
jgi:hypothetical protein